MNADDSFTANVQNAKGAAFISSLGQRPRDSCNAKPPALKARFHSGTNLCGIDGEPPR
jgi:hypothetical protein